MATPSERQKLAKLAGFVEAALKDRGMDNLHVIQGRAARNTLAAVAYELRRMAEGPGLRVPGGVEG